MTRLRFGRRVGDRLALIVALTILQTVLTYAYIAGMPACH